jgi:hypothetical protein
MLNLDIFAKEIEDTHVFKNEDLLADPSIDHFTLHDMEVIQDGQEVIWDSGATKNVTGDRHGYLEILGHERDNYRS